MKLINILNPQEKELFCEKLSKCFSSCNVNILLGAGFSIPVLSALGNIENKLTHAKKCGNAAELYEIEKEFFELCILPLIDKEKISKTESTRNLFLHSLISIIAARHSSVLHKTINIFTTNYDNLIEYSLEDKFVDYFDGFSGRITSVFSTNNYGKIIAKQSVINNKTSELVSVNLIKLHGSLYWSTEGEKIVFKDFKGKIEKANSIINTPEVFVDYYENNFLIVNPNAEKFNVTVLNANYYDQLRLLGNELEKNNTLLLAFGFSFNDEHLKIIIDRALENPTLTLVVFAYDEESLLTYKEKFQNASNVIILYTAEVNSDSDELLYNNLTLQIAAKFLEDIFYGIK